MSGETTTLTATTAGGTTIGATTATAAAATNSIFVLPENTRLITIVAHVDHGKTTLADNLIEYNGIISERLAGTLRYLDSDPEEQRRGITMRTSAIALKHRYYHHHPTTTTTTTTTTSNSTSSANENDNKKKNGARDTIIHVLDSPGHTDFCMEVSSAVTACDGALIVIDAVEGMGPRSHQVLREAYSNRLIPILVINKIDRLCTELCLNPIEAYIKLRNLIESVNATASAMITSARTIDNSNNSNNDDKTVSTLAQQQRADEKDRNKVDADDDEERIWTFDPSGGNNNVIFSSALFGWGFTIQSLARSLFRSKIIPTIKPVQLRKYLFGDYKLTENNTKIVKWKQQQQQQHSSDDDSNIPMFAKYGLQPIWSIYEGVATAAISMGIKSTLFTDGRGGAVSNTSSFAKSHGTCGGSTSSINSNSKSTKKQQNEAKIRANTPGMDQVLEWIQIGAAITQGSGGQGTKGPQLTVISTVEELQSILTRTGANTEETILRCLLRRYRPLADCVLDTICEHCPSPKEAALQKRSQSLILQDYYPDNKANNDDDSRRLQDYEKIKADVSRCSIENDAASVAHICKFLSSDLLHIRDSGLAAACALGSVGENGEDSKSTSVILGIARVLSGKLRTGAEYYLMGPKYNPKEHYNSLPKRTIRLYLLMGSSFVKVDEVPAGHLCGIYYDLKDVEMFKTVTLCDRSNAMPLRTIDNRVRPLVKVNIEPENGSDMYLLERGLAKLALADAAVEVTSTAKGERILACLGELHLEQSILDLERTYCGKEIKLRISDPIVDFAETTTWFENELEYSTFPFFDDSSTPPLRQTTIPPYNEEEGIVYAKNGRCRSILSGRCATIWVRVVPLATSIHRILMKYDKSIDATDITIDDDEIETELLKFGKALNCSGIKDNINKKETALSVLNSLRDALCSIDGNGNALVESMGLRDGSCVRGVESDEICVQLVEKQQQKQDKNSTMNKRQTNTTSVKEKFAVDAEHVEIHGDVDASPVKGKIEYQTLLSTVKESTGLNTVHVDESNEAVDKSAWNIWKSEMRGSVVAGFQLAVRAGPVCEEPVHNVLVVLEGAEIALTRHSNRTYVPSKALSGGMVVASMRSGIRCALLSRPVRLMEGHLRLTLHSSLAGLGALYPVLSKRRGKVLDDSMVDGTDLLMITASIPQAEAFGLAPELFKKASGEVTAPEMLFSHWECLDVDPFWIPTSEEEREDFGELQTAGDSSTGLDNTALSYIRMVRQRKGLMIDSSRTVISAEKQRTLKR